MNDQLRICSLSLATLWKDKEANFKEIKNAFAAEEADIFVLPEMFSTGFCMEAEEIADRDRETLNWMKEFSADKNAAVAGSAAVAEGDRYVNRFYFVKPDGAYEYYDKRHLFSYSGEDQIYSPGNERKIVEYKGWRILLQVCYDLRFPVFARSKKDYDLALYVANWPEKRADAWLHLLKARAIENQAYVVGVNRTGTDGNNLQYSKSSRAFFADGRNISNPENDIDRILLDKKVLLDFREHFKFLDDADDFKLNF